MSLHFTTVHEGTRSLWKGCMLAGIAHAIMVAHYPELSYEHSWDGSTYSVQNGQGARGTVTFDPGFCVAAFRVEGLEPRHKTAQDYFRGAPKEILELAEAETLQYLLDHVGGRIVPNITAAFWGHGDQFMSCDPFHVMMDHGGFLLKNQMMTEQEALLVWRDYWGMSEAQVRLTESLFERKVRSPQHSIRLTRSDINAIASDNVEGLTECQTSFLEIGIEWEL